MVISKWNKYIASDNTKVGYTYKYKTLGSTTKHTTYLSSIKVNTNNTATKPPITKLNPLAMIAGIGMGNCLTYNSERGKEAYIRLLNR